MNQVGNEERITFLDNLRAVVIVFVIVLLGLMTYMKYAPEWWYVVDHNTSFIYTLVVLSIEGPIIFILLFIAGYFAYPSIVERRRADFIRNKLIRIAAPWLVGVLFLTPPVAFLSVYSRTMSVPYALFLEKHFWEEYYQQSVYWFLGVLLVLFFAVYILYSLSRSFRSFRLTYTAPTWTKITIFLAGMSVCFFVINLAVSIDDWRHFGYIIMLQPVRIPLYIGYFFLGIYAFKNGWFGKTGYSPDSKIWLPLTVFSAIVYSTTRIALEQEIGPSFAVAAVTAVTFNMLCYSALMSALALSIQYLNTRNWFWKKLARNSYGIYYIHPLILFPLALYMLPFEISIFIKAPVIIIASLSVSWLISAAVLTKLPILKEMF